MDIKDYADNVRMFLFVYLCHLFVYLCNILEHIKHLISSIFFYRKYRDFAVRILNNYCLKSEVIMLLACSYTPNFLL